MIPHTYHHRAENMILFPGLRQTADRHEQAELAAIRFVRKLGIRPNLTGYQLLVSAIVLAVKYPGMLSSLTRQLYPRVAELHGCDVRAVERNIRKAIESAYEYDPERIRSVFYFKVKKPYISEVLSLAVETIRYESAVSNLAD